MTDAVRSVAGALACASRLGGQSRPPLPRRRRPHRTALSLVRASGAAASRAQGSRIRGRHEEEGPG